MRLETKVIEALRDTQKNLASGESCTGGLLAHRLTNISGASAVFLGGLVTYSNAAKHTLLGISQAVLKRHGAVSEKVATQMAIKVRTLHKADFGIGISGIAGPTGGTKAKPVGLVYIAVSTARESLCAKCQFQGTRAQIKQQAADQALKLLLEFT